MYIMTLLGSSAVLTIAKYVITSRSLPVHNIFSRKNLIILLIYVAMQVVD